MKVKAKDIAVGQVIQIGHGIAYKVTGLYSQLMGHPPSSLEKRVFFQLEYIHYPMVVHPETLVEVVG